MKDSFILRVANSLLVLVALTLPFQLYLPLSAFPLSTIYPLIAVVAALLVAHGAASLQTRFVVPRPAIPFVVFIVVIIASLVYARDRMAGLMSLVQVIMYFIWLITVPNLIRSEKDILRPISALLIGYSLSSILGVAQAVIGTRYPEAVIGLFYGSPLANLTLGARGLERLAGQEDIILFRGNTVEGAGQLFRGFGFFVGPTVYGWFTVAGAVLALGLWMALPRHQRFLCRLALFASIVGALAVLFSWTRSAWLALLIGAVFVVSFRKAKSAGVLSVRWWQFAMLGVTAICVLLLIGLARPNSTLGRMILTAANLQSSSSNAGRLGTVMFAAERIWDSPLIGVGFRNYAYAQSGILASQTATEASAHNTYLELAVELGMPGLLAFLWLLAVLMRDARRLIQYPIGSTAHALGVAVGGVWLTYAVICVFSGTVVEPKWMPVLWLIAALQTAALHIYGARSRIYAGKALAPEVASSAIASVSSA